MVDLRRLKVAGVALPILFVLCLELIRRGVVESGGGDYGFHGVLALSVVVAVVAFSFVMFHFIERAQERTAEVVGDLRRRQREGHGFYDVLLRVSNQEPLADVLGAVARHARQLLSADHAAVCLDEATARSVQVDPGRAAARAPREGICLLPEGEDSYRLHDLAECSSLRAAPQVAESLEVPIQTREEVFGELWIGRDAAAPFTERDRQFLSTLSDLASIAVRGAQMRESERRGAILAERERIARELHDSLAQVLGATHLRLRALSARGDVPGAGEIAADLDELADACEEGYRDARGAILDLHEASRDDRDLLDSLRAYLDKYSQQCGVETSLQADLRRDLSLPPHSEIQIIRVVQEALANVRKHSGADSATVRIAQGEGTVTFVVSDDGRGFDSAATLLERDGFGLRSMRERMELIGGTLLTDSALGCGTRIVAQVPDAPRVAHADLDASVS